eukprot:c17348_g1_i1 orf=245-970(+)
MLGEEECETLPSRHHPLSALGSEPSYSSDLHGKRKRDREAAWTVTEMLALARAKRQEWENQAHASRSEKSKPKVEKWTEIVKIVNENGVDRAKWQKVEDKWDNMYQDFKKVCQWQSRPGAPNYWQEMSRQLRKEHNLPVNFDEDVYSEMYAFLGGRSTSMSNRDSSPSARDTPTAGSKLVGDETTGNSPLEIGQGEEVRHVDRLRMPGECKKHGNGMKTNRVTSLPKLRSSLYAVIKESTA